MVDRKQVFTNAVLTVVQIGINAAVLFFVYRFMLREFGVEKMGVWSIVTVIATVARVGDFGFSGGVTKFVAKYRAIENDAAVRQIVETGAISLTVLFGLFGLVVWLVMPFILPVLFQGPALDEAASLVPSSILAFVISAVGSVFMSALDGMLRTDRRNIIQILAALVYCGSTVVLTSKEGLIGIAHAQLAQAITLLVGAAVSAKLSGGMRGWLPRDWRSDRFREMATYNANLQVGVISSFFLDPLSKILLGKFGGLEAAGYFEMATKMVSQFRAIVVNVNQVLVPVIAQLHEYDQQQVRRLYVKTYSILFFIALLFYSCLAIILPIISFLWLGSRNSFFISTSAWVLVTMFINTLTGPAYFSNQGTGQVWLNTKAQFLMGVANLIFGFFAGWFFGAVGVIGAYGVAIALGSIYLLVRFTTSMEMPLVVILPADLRRYSIVCVLVVLLSCFLFRDILTLNSVLCVESVCLCLVVAALGFRCTAFGSIRNWVKLR